MKSSSEANGVRAVSILALFVPVGQFGIGRILKLIHAGDRAAALVLVLLDPLKVSSALVEISTCRSKRGGRG